MKKITFLKPLSLLLSLFCAVNIGFGQSIFSNPITGTNPASANPYTSGQIVANNITVSGIGRNTSGTSSAAATNDRYIAGSWNTTGIDLTAYFEFILTPNPGYKIDFTSFQYTYRRSATGPNNIAIRSSIDAYSNDIVSFTSGTAATDIPASLNLSAISYQNITSSITFRIYGWNASAGTGTFSINDFAFNGTVSAIPCSTTTTWNGATWSAGAPDINTNASINGYYNTETHGNITACSLTVANGALLVVADNTFVEIKNNITVNTGCEFGVQPYGAVVQINDAGTITNNGDMYVIKKTAPANAWYEYTYWSSPVGGETIGGGLEESNIYRRYAFNAQNFLDAFAETGNNNATIAGQDDIDDNGDDWRGLSGSEIMVPGVGYAATHDPLIFNSSFGNQIDYVFEGEFNNGIISVPLYRNDAETADYNWNFIGNPYPSAIDVDLFLAANSNIDGAIFLWSQNTPPSNATNGNETSNFSNDDYAIINALDQIAGGDSVQPNRFIPSGQGFFVSMSNSAPSTVVTGTIHKATNDVVFNNAMRVKGATDNSQFFKNTNTKGKSNSTAINKLRLNLTSDNGLFNQILVGYIAGATDGDDGMAYDTYKYPSKGAVLYSIIEGSDKKFAIQGKDVNSINENETVKLGFKSTVNVATLFKLSVAQLEGDFLNSNTIYLKDNLLNKVHNLSASDYAFTSGVGEFNDRFVISFSNQALAIEDVLTNKNNLKIIDLDNNYVQFKASNNLHIKTITIFDLMGRQLYEFKGNASTETFKLSNLSNSMFIAKVELANGAIISKKAYKK